MTLLVAADVGMGRNSVAVMPSRVRTGKALENRPAGIVEGDHSVRAWPTSDLRLNVVVVYPRPSKT